MTKKLFQFFRRFVYDSLKNIRSRLSGNAFLLNPRWPASKLNNLPKSIDEYQLVKSLKQDLSSTYKAGLYKNKSGDLVVGKMWKGDFKNSDYFRLHKEIVTYQVLSQAIKRIGHLTPHSLKSISIPRYIGFTESNNSLCLFIEYVNGVSLDSTISSDKQHVYFKKCIEYIKFIGNHLTSSEKSQLTTKVIQKDLPLYPFVLLLVIIRRPRLAVDLIKGFYSVILNSFQIMRDANLTLVHGDLHPHNLIRDGERIVILDLEEMIITHSAQELVFSILCLPTAQPLRRKLIKDSQTLPHFSILAVNSSIHYLAGNITHQKVNLCVQTLRQNLK